MGEVTMDIRKMLTDSLYNWRYANNTFDREEARDKIDNLLEFAGYWLTDEEQDEIIAIYDNAMDRAREEGYI
jgi:hypothetical protein